MAIRAGSESDDRPGRVRSNTQTEPRPQPTASTVDQGRQDQFCADVADVLTRTAPQIPRIGRSVSMNCASSPPKSSAWHRDDITAAKVLQSCQEESTLHAGHSADVLSHRRAGVPRWAPSCSITHFRKLEHQEKLLKSIPPP